MVIKQTSKGNNNVQVGGSIVQGDSVILKEFEEKLKEGKFEVILPEIEIPEVTMDPKHIVSTCVINNEVWFNGEQLPPPPKSKFRGTAVEIVNKHIWVSGWYWNGEKWIKMSKLRFKLMRKN